MVHSQGLPSRIGLPNIRAMSDPNAQPVWRFRLMILTALAVLVLAVLWLRSRADITRVEKHRTAMIATLRALVAAQDAHQARTGRYAMTLDALPSWTAPATLDLTFTPVDATTWGAAVRDTALRIAPTHCGVYVGAAHASPHRAVVHPGSPACW
jgi:hypothetical protein